MKEIYFITIVPKSVKEGILKEGFYKTKKFEDLAELINFVYFMARDYEIVELLSCSHYSSIIPKLPSEL